MEIHEGTVAIKEDMVRKISSLFNIRFTKNMQGVREYPNKSHANCIVVDGLYCQNKPLILPAQILKIKHCHRFRSFKLTNSTSLDNICMQVNLAILRAKIGYNT